MEITYTIHTKDVLIAIIQEANELYRKGKPNMSDAAYDCLVENLKELDPNNEWFNKIEPAPVSEGRKRKTPIQMKSLNKAKNLLEVDQWIKSLSLSKLTEVVCMPKFDGGSLLCDEINKQAYSRGGSENEGQDCTPHAEAKGLFEKKAWGVAYTFGEFMIDKPNWDEHFKEKTSPYSGDKYKSPRNTACGFLNRDIPVKEIEHTSFFRYGIDPGSLGSYSTYEQLISTLCDCYGQKHCYERLCVSQLSEERLREMYVLWSKLYPIDGIVVYINDLRIWDKIGRHQSTGNPLYAIAYKHPDFNDAFTTTVIDVSWKVSKSGALKPVVQVEPVDTGDCMMENPTGYNAAWVNDREIAPGAQVTITRSGGVIPKIIGVPKAAELDSFMKMWDDLAECPCCGFPTQWDSVDLKCTNQRCLERVVSEIAFFYQVCGAENIGEETLLKLALAGINTHKSLLNATFDELMSVEGIGECMANIILENNKKIMKGLDMPTYMHSSNCFQGIGKAKAEKVINEMLNDEDREEFLNLELYEYGEYAPNKTLQSFHKGLDSFYAFVRDTNIPILRQSITQPSSDRFDGMTVCFSGVRSVDAERKFIDQGGKVSGTVSKKTTFLVVKYPHEQSAKISKAQTLKIRIVNINDFISML